MKDIVYVDDEPLPFLSHATKQQKKRIADFAFALESPDNLAFAAAKKANVWLFDFFLVHESAKAYRDENGLSLFQKWKATVGARPVTVLVSNDLPKAVGEPLGPVERHHVAAQRHGVEWIGDKSAATFKRLIDLADAASAIGKALKTRRVATTFETDRLAFDVLGVPRKAEWANSASRQIDRARPPRNLLAAPRPEMARAIVGWLVAHVLPYPSFLLTDAQAALRLKIHPASFRALAAAIEGKTKGNRYRRAFAGSRYSGPLAVFLGRRWWRAAIDDLAWNLSEAKGDYRTSLADIAQETKLKWLEQAEPVLVSNDDLVETDDVAEANDCVRVTDEDFPANVDPAWVRIGAARENRRLRAKVVFEDRELLSAVK